MQIFLWCFTMKMKKFTPKACTNLQNYSFNDYHGLYGMRLYLTQRRSNGNWSMQPFPFATFNDLT